MYTYLFILHTFCFMVLDYVPTIMIRIRKLTLIGEKDQPYWGKKKSTGSALALIWRSGMKVLDRISGNWIIWFRFHWISLDIRF